MGRFGFVGRRLVQMVPVALGVTIITFFLIHLIPGDPAVAMLGSHYTTAGAAALRKALGLDQPLWTQYLIFMGNLLHGNLGDSIYYEQPVLGLILERLAPRSGWCLCRGAGACSSPCRWRPTPALHRDSIVDQFIRGMFMVTLAMPAFWVGIMLILVLSVNVHLFPVSGFGDSVRLASVASVPAGADHRAGLLRRADPLAAQQHLSACCARTTSIRRAPRVCRGVASCGAMFCATPCCPP